MHDKVGNLLAILVACPQSQSQQWHQHSIPSRGYSHYNLAPHPMPQIKAGRASPFDQPADAAKRSTRFADPPSWQQRARAAHALGRRRSDKRTAREAAAAAVAASEGWRSGPERAVSRGTSMLPDEPTDRSSPGTAGSAASEEDSMRSSGSEATAEEAGDEQLPPAAGPGEQLPLLPSRAAGAAAAAVPQQVQWAGGGAAAPADAPAGAGVLGEVRLDLGDSLPDSQQDPQQAP